MDVDGAAIVVGVCANESGGGDEVDGVEMRVSKILFLMRMLNGRWICGCEQLQVSISKIISGARRTRKDSGLCGRENGALVNFGVSVVHVSGDKGWESNGFWRE